ncbi:MAG: hypothetical protein WCX10_08425 [Bacteroidales bacterium]
MDKKALAEEKVYRGRMVSDFCLYTAQEAFEKKLAREEFVDPKILWALKFVAPYDRQGRSDKNKKNGEEKPRVQVKAFFRKKLSLRDHHELHGVKSELKSTEYKYHECDSEWHRLWKERVKDFCEIEKRIYPNGIQTKEGFKIADAFYSEANTVIEFQKSFDDCALEKSEFYKNEHIKLIWVFYLPTLEVFEDEEMYKIREDNFFHFFRIDDLFPNFFSDNMVFLQDKKDRIFLVNKLLRSDSKSELDASVREFKKDIVFNTPTEFVFWLKNDWPKLIIFKPSNTNDDLQSLDEIIKSFKDSEDKWFYLQNGIKNDSNGNTLVYCFIKSGNGFEKFGVSSYIGYRCHTDKNGYYQRNGSLCKTPHYSKNEKWVLLATDKRRYTKERTILIKNS